MSRVENYDTIVTKVSQCLVSTEELLNRVDTDSIKKYSTSRSAAPAYINIFESG